MDATERYLFDLNGYLTIPGALSARQLEAINGLMDVQVARDVPPESTTHRFADVLDWVRPSVS
jgi:hypothetical protein